MLPEILHIGYGYGRVLHAVIHHRIDGHRHRVTWQDLNKFMQTHEKMTGFSKKKTKKKKDGQKKTSPNNNRNWK